LMQEVLLNRRFVSKGDDGDGDGGDGESEETKFLAKMLHTVTQMVIARDGKEEIIQVLCKNEEDSETNMPYWRCIVAINSILSAAMSSCLSETTQQRSQAGNNGDSNNNNNDPMEATAMATSQFVSVVHVDCDPLNDMIDSLKRYAPVLIACASHESNSSNSDENISNSEDENQDIELNPNQQALLRSAHIAIIKEVNGIFQRPLLDGLCIDALVAQLVRTKAVALESVIEWLVGRETSDDDKEQQEGESSSKTDDFLLNSSYHDRGDLSPWVILSNVISTVFTLCASQIQEEMMEAPQNEEFMMIIDGSNEDGKKDKNDDEADDEEIPLLPVEAKKGLEDVARVLHTVCHRVGYFLGSMTYNNNLNHQLCPSKGKMSPRAVLLMEGLKELIFRVQSDATGLYLSSISRSKSSSSKKKQQALSRVVFSAISENVGNGLSLGKAVRAGLSLAQQKQEQDAENSIGDAQDSASTPAVVAAIVESLAQCLELGGGLPLP